MGILIEEIVNVLKEVAIEVLQVVVECLNEILKSLGADIVVDEKLGDKGLQAEEKDISLENFDNDYERFEKSFDEFEIDPEQSDKYTDVEKLQKAAYLAVEKIEHNYPDLHVAEMVDTICSNQDYFTPEKATALAKLSSDNKGVGVQEVYDYFNGNINDNEHVEMAIDTLVKVEKLANPDISQEEALRNALQARQ